MLRYVTTTNQRTNSYKLIALDVEFYAVLKEKIIYKEFLFNLNSWYKSQLTELRCCCCYIKFSLVSLASSCAVNWFEINEKPWTINVLSIGSILNHLKVLLNMVTTCTLNGNRLYIKMNSTFLIQQLATCLEISQ